MKIVIPKSKFTAALTAVANVVSNKGMPIQSFAKLDANEGKVHITATDLDSFYTRTVECETLSPGMALLHVRKIKEWLEVVPDGDVEIVADGKSIALAVGSDTSWNKFATMDPAEFPRIPAVPLLHLATADFAPLKHVAWSIYRDDDARPEMCAAFLEIEGDGLVAATSDGRKIGQVIIKAELGAAFKPLQLADKYVQLVASLGPCRFSSSDNNLHFEGDDFDLVVRKSEHPVPQWRRATTMFPIVGSCKLMREEFAQSIARCHLNRGGELGSEKGVRVTIEKDPEGVKLSCLVEKTAESYATVLACKATGEFPSVVLSTEHLMPFLKLPEEAPLKIEFTGTKTMVFMTAPTLGVSYAFAPMYPKGEA